MIAHVHKFGMSFDLWFEPERVTRNSDHSHTLPDWQLGPADNVVGRHQMVLDMARTEA